MPPGEVARAAPAVLLILGAFFALSSEKLRAKIEAWLSGSAPRMMIAGQAIALPYLCYALALGIFSTRDFVALLVYLDLPLVILVHERRRGATPWLDFAALLLLWLPIEMRWLPALWSWPAGQSGRWLNGFLGALLAIFGFGVVRALPGIGFTLHCRARDLAISSAAAAAFLPIGLALGWRVGFLGHFKLPSSPAAAALRIPAIFLLTAILEELLFRGLLQNLLRAWTGRPWLAVGLASLCFGAAHANVGAVPDWRLPLLATLAGLAYGWAYEKGGTLMAPALAHTFINSFWILLFRR